MTLSLADLYEQAVNSGDTATANYYAQALYAQANPGASIANVTAASPAQIAANSGSNSSGGFFTGLQSATQGLFNWISKNDPTTGTFLDPNPTGDTTPISVGQSVGAATSTAIGGAAGALSFLEDLPRVAVTVIGLLFIIAGIFALSRGQTVLQVAGLNP